MSATAQNAVSTGAGPAPSLTAVRKAIEASSETSSPALRMERERGVSLAIQLSLSTVLRRAQTPAGSLWLAPVLRNRQTPATPS